MVVEAGGVEDGKTAGEGLVFGVGCSEGCNVVDGDVVVGGV